MSKWRKSKLDLNQLELEIQQMSVRSKLYKVLKAELTKVGYWKQKARGNPRAGYRASHRNEKNI